jgi:hypothetical protein
MKKVVRAYPKQELHVVLDNSSTHSTPHIEAWLVELPEVHFHYAPTSASWLNPVGRPGVHYSTQQGPVVAALGHDHRRDHHKS